MWASGKAQSLLELESAPGAWIWAPLFSLSAASLVVVASVALRPQDPHRVTAIFPPWWSAERSLDAASRVAGVTGFGALPFIIAVAGRQGDLETELRAAGAIAVVDGRRFAFCGSLKNGV